MVFRVHIIFAFISLFTIIAFWCSTVIVEVFYGIDEITLVKSLIVLPGLFILIPSLAITAISGNLIAKKSSRSKLISIKKKRMPKIAALGIFLLIPCALYLDYLASNLLFDIRFYIFQALEIVVGGINIYLISKNIYDSKSIKD